MSLSQFEPGKTTTPNFIPFCFDEFINDADNRINYTAKVQQEYQWKSEK
jgi:hypothetical protein